MGLGVATKAFCKLLFNRDLSDSFQQMLDGNPQPKIEPAKKAAEPTKPKPTPAPTRSDAITLLSSLQREARLLDIVNESLDQYSDEQVGAAARDVLKDTGRVFERMFGLTPMTDKEDGAQLETPTKFDPSEYRLTGNVSGKAPFTGTVAHHGWKATKCDVPKWSGDASAGLVIAPVELELT